MPAATLDARPPGPPGTKIHWAPAQGVEPRSVWSRLRVAPLY